MDQIGLQVNGFNFDALVEGPPDGDVVIFLHGFPQFADSWIEIMHRVAEAGFRAVAIDQRGYSPGARPLNVQDYSVDLLVSDVLGFADALNAHRFHLVGHDWGGIVAWKFSAGHPDRLYSLTVLSTPHPDAFLKTVWKEPSQLWRSKYILLFKMPFHLAETMLLADNARAIRAAYQGQVGGAQVERNITRLRHGGTLTAALNWYRALKMGMRTGPVAVPTLYAWGANDFALGETAARQTANYITGPYRFEVLKGMSHWLTDEAPEFIAELIRKQLKA